MLERANIPDSGSWPGVASTGMLAADGTITLTDPARGNRVLSNQGHLAMKAREDVPYFHHIDNSPITEAI